MKPLILLFALVFTGCDTVEKFFLEEELLQRPPSQKCGECHQKIYSQWEKSRHSVAWISEGFVRSSKSRTKSKCLSCHAPLEVLPEEKPQLREKLQEEGVNCFSCHYREDTNSIHGPYKVFSPPHYSTYDPDYISSRICSGCHQKTYSQWKQTDSKKNCQDCHMPSKKDWLVQKFPFGYFHSRKKLHSHTFPAGKLKNKDIKISLQKQDDVIVLKITNTGVPHNVPTAEQGNPKLYIQLTALEQGKEIFKDSVMLTHKNGLQFNKQKEVYFFLPDTNVERFKVEFYRKLPYQTEREKLFTVYLPN
ncbi:multiheme c-type cytochrome [Persephonella sp.]